MKAIDSVQFSPWWNFCKQVKEYSGFVVITSLVWITPRAIMYSFDGDFRRRPIQSLGGASKKVNNSFDDFLPVSFILPFLKCSIIFECSKFLSSHTLGVMCIEGCCDDILQCVYIPVFIVYFDFIYIHVCNLHSSCTAQFKMSTRLSWRVWSVLSFICCDWNRCVHTRIGTLQLADCKKSNKIN